MMLVSTKQSIRKSFRPSLVTEKVAVKDKEVVVWADRDFLHGYFWFKKEKCEVSMKGFLNYLLVPFAWFLATAIGNVYRSAKTDLFTGLETKIDLVNQIPVDPGWAYGGMRIIR